MGFKASLGCASVEPYRKLILRQIGPVLENNRKGGEPVGQRGVIEDGFERFACSTWVLFKKELRQRFLAQPPHGLVRGKVIQRVLCG
jgi:hypothetical protein